MSFYRTMKRPEGDEGTMWSATLPQPNLNAWARENEGEDDLIRVYLREGATSDLTVLEQNCKSVCSTEYKII